MSLGRWTVENELKLGSWMSEKRKQKKKISVAGKMILLKWALVKQNLTSQIFLHDHVSNIRNRDYQS